MTKFGVSVPYSLGMVRQSYSSSPPSDYRYKQPEETKKKGLVKFDCRLMKAGFLFNRQSNFTVHEVTLFFSHCQECCLVNTGVIDGFCVCTIDRMGEPEDAGTAKIRDLRNPKLNCSKNRCKSLFELRITSAC